MGRRDAKLVKNLDPMHIIVPAIFVGRCDNEAFISQRIDLTKANEFIAKRNENLQPEADGKVFKYTLFHLAVMAMMKTIKLRPKMNWFIANKRIYERNDISAAFTVKKVFSDDGAEALAVLKADDGDNIDTIREKIKKQVYSTRSDKLDSTTESMDIVCKLPFFLIRFIVWVVRKLDLHGKVPQSMIDSDLFYTSVVLSNLGSIKLKSGYHHLVNWGTNSIIVLIGEKKFRPFFNEDGTYVMRDSFDLGITIDERIADGYYYSKSVRLLKKLLENPELLELPIEEEVEY